MPRRWDHQRGGHEREGDRRDAVSGAAGEPSIAELIALQQTAGNAAVARLMQSQSALVAGEGDDEPPVTVDPSGSSRSE